MSSPRSGSLGVLRCALLVVIVGAGGFGPLAANASARGRSDSETPVPKELCASRVETGKGASSAQLSPEPHHPCWVEEAEYPFKIEGEGEASCTANSALSCDLTVTSMAFRAWNRGLAATEWPNAPRPNPFGVWVYRAVREVTAEGVPVVKGGWTPAPLFPGSQSCPGHTVLWAGKLDYWLIGGPTDQGWSPLCRYDGANLEWSILPVPSATLQRITSEPTPEHPSGIRRPGGITSGACFAWNDCWFFGTYGSVVHWEGEKLSDASPPPSEPWLDGEYLAAVAHQDPFGTAFGVAVGATSEYRQPTNGGELLAPPPGGAAPVQMLGSSGGAFTPLPFSPPTHGQAAEAPVELWSDPFRTDLVAVDFDDEGHGWVAGNPAGVRVTAGPPSGRGFLAPEAPQPAPLVPVNPAGEQSCAGPGKEAFTYTQARAQLPTGGGASEEGGYLWSSLAVIPGSDEVLAAGLMLPPASAAGSEPNEDSGPEPVIVRADCEGTESVTRFRVPDVTGYHEPAVPGDRNGWVEAVAASAANDAWAATSRGNLIKEVNNGIAAYEEEPARLYHLTDGEPPEAFEGDDQESRPRVELPDLPIIVIEPPGPEPPAPAPAVITKKRKVKLKPAVYALHSKLRHRGASFSLYLTFKVRRPVTIGAEALRDGHVVSRAKPRRFSGHSGVLVLHLQRSRWPTKIRFVT